MHWHTQNSNDTKQIFRIDVEAIFGDAISVDPSYKKNIIPIERQLATFSNFTTPIFLIE